MLHRHRGGNKWKAQWSLRLRRQRGRPDRQYPAHRNPGLPRPGSGAGRPGSRARAGGADLRHPVPHALAARGDRGREHAFCAGPRTLPGPARRTGFSAPRGGFPQRRGGTRGHGPPGPQHSSGASGRAGQGTDQLAWFDEGWRELMQGARMAAEHGQKEAMLLRFPCQLCIDGGRAINVAEQVQARDAAGQPSGDLPALGTISSLAGSSAVLVGYERFRGIDVLVRKWPGALRAPGRFLPWMGPPATPPPSPPR